MNKIDILTPTLSSQPASLSTPETARRLLVLIPALDWDYIPAMRTVWELATARGAGVLLLSLYGDAPQELSLRRSLTTMGAMLQDSGILVEVALEFGTNWEELVKKKHHTGDMIVCFAGEYTGPLHQPLSQILLSSLKIPVYILPSPSLRRLKSNWRSEILEWSGYLGILIGFGLLQINIVARQDDAFQTIMLVLSLIPEFWLIQVWNHLFI